MYVYHPKQSENGLPPEDVFIVADSSGTPVAEGSIVSIVRPYLFPERPLNMYISIRSQGLGMDILIGALLARAAQVHETMPALNARLYAQVEPQNAAMMAFYLENGFAEGDCLNVVRLGIPRVRPGAPAGYAIDTLPLANDTEKAALLSRLNKYRLGSWQNKHLQQMMQYPIFLPMYLSRGSDIVGELLLVGNGQYAKLMGMYIVPEYRNHGLGKALLATGMQRLVELGIKQVEADLIQRNSAQKMLANSCDAIYIRTTYLYPGIDYDALP